MIYPETKTVDVTETRFGVKVDDPYRWLENDVRTDGEIERWVQAQDDLTRSYLAQLPQRDIFLERFKILLATERLGAPQMRGGTVFLQA